MKRPLFSLALALLVGVGAFFGMRSHALKEQKSSLLVDQLPELSWLKTELQLRDDELTKVKELHLAYRPTCLEMCKRIADARVKLQKMTESQREWNPELEQAIQEHAKVQADCQRAMLQHLYKTAAVLEPEKAERFLKSALPAALGGYHGDGTETCHAR
jgi:hypothetical protein